jgi:hypothetical protein
MEKKIMPQSHLYEYKEGDLMSALRVKNYIKQIDPDEERVEQFIARCANSQDPQKLLDVLDKIGHIGLDMPLVELEEYIKNYQRYLLILLNSRNGLLIDSIQRYKEPAIKFISMIYRSL